MATTPVKPPNQVGVKEPTPSVAHDNPSTRPNPLHGKPDPNLPAEQQIPPYGAKPYQAVKEPRVYAPSHEQTPAERAAAQLEANKAAEAKAKDRTAELDEQEGYPTPWAADQARAQASVRAEEQAKAHRHPVTDEVPDVFGFPPEPDMAPEEDPSTGPLSDNTRAEMEAGRAMLSQYGTRTEDERAAGKRASNPNAGRTLPPSPPPHSVE